MLNDGRLIPSKHIKKLMFKKKTALNQVEKFYKT